MLLNYMEEYNLFLNIKDLGKEFDIFHNNKYPFVVLEKTMDGKYEYPQFGDFLILYKKYYLHYWNYLRGNNPLKIQEKQEKERLYEKNIIKKEGNITVSFKAKVKIGHKLAIRLLLAFTIVQSTFHGIETVIKNSAIADLKQTNELMSEELERYKTEIQELGDELREIITSEEMYEEQETDSEEYIRNVINGVSEVIKKYLEDHPELLEEQSEKPTNEIVEGETETEIKPEETQTGEEIKIVTGEMQTGEKTEIEKEETQTVTDESKDTENEDFKGRVKEICLNDGIILDDVYILGDRICAFTGYTKVGQDGCNYHYIYDKNEFIKIIPEEYQNTTIEDVVTKIEHNEELENEDKENLIKTLIKSYNDRALSNEDLILLSYNMDRTKVVYPGEGYDIRSRQLFSFWC